MSDQYLWDGSGEPDPEIVRLEKALAPLRLSPPAPARAAAATPRRARRWLAPALAGGMSLAAAGVTLWWVTGTGPLVPTDPAPIAASGPPAATAVDAPEPWLVAPLAGAPRVANVALRAAAPATTGSLIETDRHSRARISMGNIGQVELERGTRVRLVAAGAARHRLGLERGELHALIWAPAGRFHVETAAGVVTDLGCAYTLSVDEAGRGLVTVSSGWVGFEYRGRESLIPAGTTSTLREGQGPGTPLQPASARPLRALVTAVDAEDAAPRIERQLARALASARAEDAVTLWHLLARLPGALRGPVHDRLAVLAPPPPAVTRAGIVAGDALMRDSWWDVLGHGPIADWRRWKADAPPATP